MEDEENLLSIQRFLRHYFLGLTDAVVPSREPEPSDPYVPDTIVRTLQNHHLHSEILSYTGSGPGVPNVSVMRMLMQREHNQVGVRRSANKQMRNTRCCPMSPKSRAHITQRYLPNKSSDVASYRDAIFCGTFSQDGSLFMTACKDETIRLYDTQIWKKATRSITARDVGWSIISTDYSPDQQWLIYSSWSSFVHLVNVTGEKEVHEALDFQPDAPRFCLFSIQFSPDSKEILGGSSDCFIYIYDLETKVRTERVQAHTDDVNAVAYVDQSNQLILSGSDDCLIKLWDRRIFSKGCVGILPGHSQGITYIDSKLDSRYFISNSKDQSIKLWDLRLIKDVNFATGRNSSFVFDDNHGRRNFSNVREHHKDDQSIMTYHGHKVMQTLIRCKFSPKESTGQKYIYTGSFDGSVYVFDTLTGKLLQRLKGHSKTTRDVHWHPTQPVIVSTGWDGRVVKWNYEHPEGPKEEELTTNIIKSRHSNRHT